MGHAEQPVRRRASRPFAAVTLAGILASSALLPAACGGGGASSSGDAGPLVGLCKSIGAANEVGPGDPREKGQCAFLYDAWGTEALGQWPPTDFMLGLLKSEPDVFGAQFEKFGFLHDPNDDLPIGFKRGLVDPTQLHETCALCHTTQLPDGKIWFGAPNTKLDVGRFQVEVSKRWVTAGHAPLFNPLSEKKALELGPGRFNAESTDYPNVVAADFPPYFTLSKRKALNYLGTGRNVRTEVFFAVYSFGAGSPNDATAKVPFPSDERLSQFLAFFGEFDAPAGPAQDAAQVMKGKSVFDAAACGKCHHVEDISQDVVVTYDKTQSAKEHLPGEDAMFPHGSIRTDILHRVLVDSSVAGGTGSGGGGGAGAGGSTGAGVDQGYQDLISFISKHALTVGQTDGYRPSDLHGLWATAPYLHNGSVPTLDDLLKKPADRPATWSRDGFPIDTSKLGNSNLGHEFGTELSDADKQALVVYLKSL